MILKIIENIFNYNYRNQDNNKVNKILKKLKI